MKTVGDGAEVGLSYVECEIVPQVGIIIIIISSISSSSEVVAACDN